MSPPSYARVAALKTAGDFREYLAELSINLGLDEPLETGEQAPLGWPLVYNGREIGNRFCVLPMEGWDGTPQGEPSELTIRRWRHFGQSGAKLIWGGEAVAVRPDGRANPNQLIFLEENKAAIGALRSTLLEEHKNRFGDVDDLLIGLQLTHSGRFCRPNDKKRLEPKILYHHPILDARFGIPPDYPCLTDDEISDLIDEFVRCARGAADLGYEFVDIKHCHGYLGHEFLSAARRPGKYGGSFENRTRFLREIVQGIRATAPGLEIGVRLSAFDTLPFTMGAGGRGVPENHSTPYPYAFGANPEDPLEIRLNETFAFLGLLRELGIRLVCVSAGSPYYCPHIQRPALFPPSDGYTPPEDPLVGVERQIRVTAELKEAFPELIFVGSGYSYLQEWLPNVAQHAVRSGMVDSVGLGRLMLSYPHFVSDVLTGEKLATKSICRTFSDCTTGPRNGLISGCFPLDPFYKDHPHAEALKQFKKSQRSR
ncbi:MAG: NADH:flavin oxidoreductase [Acidobacteriota bacterium]